MSQYKQDRLIAQLRADAALAQERAKAMLAALEKLADDGIENSRDPRTVIASEAIKADEEARDAKG